MLDLHKLQIFLAVVQEGSFSGAAERLYITQSAVSQHIKELESSLGQQLFQRGWRGVQMTSHAEILNDYALQIFALIAQAESALTNVDHLSNGRISIGATPGIGVYVVPDWVQQFRTRYPNITVSMQTGITSEIINAVLAQKLELGFIEGELNDTLPRRLSSLVLEDIEQHAVVGPRHPFWQRDSIPIADLKQQSLIVREHNSQSRIWLEKSLHKHSIQPIIGAEFDNLESIKRAVSLGLCLAIVPPYIVQNEIEQQTLHMIRIEGRPLSRQLKVIWDAGLHFSPIAHALLMELAPRYPAVKALFSTSAS